MNYKTFFKSRRNIALTGLAVTIALFFVGVKFPLTLFVVAINCLYLPMPSVFKTLISKLFLSLIATFSLIIVIGGIQYIVFPDTHFTVAAVLLTLAEVALVLWSPIRNAKFKSPIFEKQDLIPLCLSLLAIAPLLVLLLGSDSLARILIFANAQVVDAGNQFSYIIGMFNTQYLSLRDYPSGFFYGFAFITKSFIANIHDLGWRGNVIFYFSHYLILSSVLVYALYYFILGIAESYGSRFHLKLDSFKVKTLLAVTVIPSVIFFYMLPFIAQGFLNYFYVIAAFMCGILYLLSGVDASKESKISRWSLFMFLMIGFGVVSSWSPLIPLVLGIAFLYILPGKINIKLLKSLLTYKNVPVVLIGLLYLVLLYAQFTSIDVSGRGGIFESGNLHDFHYLLLMPLALLAGYLLVKSSRYSALERIVFSVYVTSFAFVLCFVLIQYFSIGEMRYYAIKIALLLEIFSLCLAGAVLVVRYVANGNQDWRKAVAIPVFSIVVVTFCVMTGGNPIGPMRELFKPSSGIPMPQFMVHDAQKIVDLGIANKIEHNNIIAVHYSPITGKFDGYSQLIYRANLMSQQNIPWEYDMSQCMNRINFLLETQPEGDEQLMIEAINHCVALSKVHKMQYYIVTDKGSLEFLRSRIDPAANLLY